MGEYDFNWGQWFVARIAPGKSTSPSSCPMCTDTRTIAASPWACLFQTLTFDILPVFLYHFWPGLTHQKLEFILMPFTTCTVDFTYFCFCLFLGKVMTPTLCLLDLRHTLAFSVFLISCMFSAADLGCKASYWALYMCVNAWCFCRSFLWIDNPYRFSFFFKSQSESRFCTVWVSSFLLCAELLRFFSWLD